jgi:hypothetical protein
MLCHILKLLYMRPLLYFCLLACLIPAACKKNNLKGTTGDWKLMLYSEGFSGRVVKIPADSLVILSLRGRDYQRTANRVVNEIGTYTIGNEETIFNIKMPVLHLNPTPSPNYPSPGLVVELVHDTLNLSMNAYDGNAFVYVRAD